MGEIEDALISNFLWLLANGQIRLPYSEGIHWTHLRGVKVGYSADIVLPKKQIDLLLVEGGASNTDWIRELNVANAQGVKFSGKRDNISANLRRMAGKNAWIVEAKDSKHNLWGALGQAFYRALVTRDYPNLNTVGSVVIYPARFGSDVVIEYALRVVMEELRVLILTIPLEISERRLDRSKRGGLDKFLQ